MAELNVCIFCGKEPEKPRQYGYQLTPRRNTCYCIDHSCGDGTFVSVHGYSAAEVVEKWNKIMPAADVAPVAEYIERSEIFRVWKNIPLTASVTSLSAAIHQTPAADVVPVRHGKLINTGYDELYCEFGDCTVCGADNPISNKFCGQCGAKMDEVSE